MHSSVVASEVDNSTWCHDSSTRFSVCGLVFNRISVRFLMALVQWCSGYVSFLLEHELRTRSGLRPSDWLVDE